MHAYIHTYTYSKPYAHLQLVTDGSVHVSLAFEHPQIGVQSQPQDVVLCAGGACMCASVRQMCTCVLASMCDDEIVY